jgi:hypothetical protein
MWRLPILKWDALGMALDAHEPPTVIGYQLSQILTTVGYTTDEVNALARALFSGGDPSSS